MYAFPFRFIDDVATERKVLHTEPVSWCVVQLDREGFTPGGAGVPEAREIQLQAARGPRARRLVRRSQVADAGGSVSAAMHAVSRRRI